MPKFSVQAPDGRTFEVNGPEGSSQADAIAFVQKNLYKPAKGPDPSEGGGTLQFGPLDTGIKTPQWLDRGLAGVGKAFNDIGMGASQIGAGIADTLAPRKPAPTGLKPLSRVDEMRQKVAEQRGLDAPLMDTTAGTVGNIAGNVAMFAPTAFVPGANTITGSALIGAASGLIQPSASTNETIGNVGLGAATSAALPILTTGYRVAKSFAEPLYQGGRDKIVGRALNSAAGTDAAVAQSRLASAGSIVPGSMPTVAEAAEVPSLAAIQRTASATTPNVTNQLAARNLANNDARIAALQQIIGDKGLRESAREAATNALYAAANGKTVTLTPELEALLARPQMQAAVSGARNLAADEGRAFSLKPSMPPQPSSVLGANGMPMSVVPGAPGSMVTQDAHTIKRALDDTIEGLAGANGLGKNARRAAIGTKEAFLGELEKQVPEYGAARTTYAAMSKPVNQSEVAQMILDRAAGGIQGNMTPAAFNRAMSDRTAKSALGRTNATLGDVFEPGQMDALNAIKEDLRRLDFANTAGRGAGSDTVQKLAYTNMMDQAGIPTMLRNSMPGGVVGSIGQRVAQIGYKDANEKLAEQLALTMLDPKLAASLMKKATQSQGLLTIENGTKRALVPLGGVVPGLLSENLE